jgi:hypothetical protein
MQLGRRIMGMAIGGALIVALVASSTAGADPAPVTVTGTFDALTYNVAGLPEALSGSEPDENTPLISPLLNPYDLVLVQEDWIDPVPPNASFNFHHDDLVSAVTHPYQSTPAVPPLGSNPLRKEALVADGLNRLARFPFGPVTRVMWDGCFGGFDTSDGGAADCISEKGFSVAVTEIAPGVFVDVYNLHGEAGRTSTDIALSQADFAQLAAYIQANSAGHAVIVAGDTNLHTDRVPDGETWQTFLAVTGLADVCETVDCGADVDVIDKFAFRSGGGVTLEARSHTFERETFKRADGEPLSDHDPLAVTFAYTAQVVPTTTPPTSTPSAPPADQGTSAPAVAVPAEPTYTG